ncbi:MAG TPA: signal peptide peptidase SppA [bacterium]|nr:signal peptide peptidase SppA [bacterium]
MKSRNVLLGLFLTLVVLVAMATVVLGILISIHNGRVSTLLGEGNVALVRIEGVLYDVQEWLDQIEEYGEDSAISAVVVRIDSPGGAIAPSQDLYRAILELREKHHKTVVASFGSIAASGGYYATCGANAIVSSEGTLTGSVGVYMKLWQAESLLEKIGIDAETIKAGRFKDVGDFDRALTPEERQMLQETIDDMYDQFVEVIEKGRRNSFLKLLRSDPVEMRQSKINETGDLEYPYSEEILGLIEEYRKSIPAEQAFVGPVPAGEPMPATNALSEATAALVNEATEANRPPMEVEKRLLKEFARQVADGKIYTGRQAKEIGLVDHLGTLDDAIKLAAKIAGIQGEPNVIEKKPGRQGLIDLLTEGLAKVTESRVYSPFEYRFPY